MKSSSKLVRMLGAIALGTLLLSPVTPLAAQEDLSGRWVLSSSTERANALRDRGIDRSVSEMSMMVRGIARRRIRQQLPVPRAVEIHGEAVHIGRYRMSLPSDGSWQQTTDPWGNSVRARRVRRGDRVVQEYQSDDGVLRHTLRRRGDRLVLHVRVSSPRLDRAVSYQVSYRRVD